MVNKAEQSQNDIQDVGNTTTDVTEEFAGVNTPPEGTVVPEADVESTEATPVTEEKPVTDAEGAKEAPPVSEESTKSVDARTRCLCSSVGNTRLYA